MLKKTISWLLILALLCSCCMLSVFATEPTSDEEAKTQGYHFKVTASDGTVTYGKFNETVAADGSRDGAFAKVASGSTVTLLTDATVARELHLNGVYTIDGAGKTLNARLRSDSGSANVTVRNVTFDVTLTSGNGYFYQLNAGNKCVFETCTFDMKGEPDSAVFVQRGDLTISDSSFTYTTSSSKPVFHQDDQLKEAKLLNTTFNLDNAANAKIGLPAGVNGTYYRFLKNAMDNAKAGNTIYLLEDYASTENERDRLYIDKQVTVDGNGHTVFANYPGYAVRVNDNVKGVVIRNLNMIQDGKGAAFQVNAGATATVEKSVIQCTKETPYGTVILSGTLTLGNGAKIISDGATENGSNSVGVRMHRTNAELIVNDGAEITTVGNSFKANDKGAGVTSSNITINGGTITTSRHMWEANEAGYTLTIKGGTFVSKHATDALICLYGTRTPTVNLLGGTFTAKKIIDTNDAITAIGGTITLNGKVIFRGPTPEEFKNTEASIYMPSGNVATKNNSGVQFTTKVDKNWYDAIDAMEGVTVNRMGTLIVPKSYVDAANGVFTKEAIEAAGKQCKVDIVNSGWYNAETAAADGFYFYAGVLVKLSAATVSGELVGIGYVTVTVEGLGTFTIYGNQMNAKVSELAASWSANDDAQQAVLNFFRGNAG